MGTFLVAYLTANNFLELTNCDIKCFFVLSRGFKTINHPVMQNFIPLLVLFDSLGKEQREHRRIIQRVLLP